MLAPGREYLAPTHEYSVRGKYQQRGHQCIPTGSQFEMPSLLQHTSDLDVMIVMGTISTDPKLATVNVTMVKAAHAGFIEMRDEKGDDHGCAQLPDAHNYVSKNQLNARAHGPAVSTEMMMGSRLSEIDHVPCYHVAEWPTQARGWPSRTRPSGWPTKEAVEEIVSLGCHVVPICHKKSSAPTREWRLSFSLAEKNSNAISKWHTGHCNCSGEIRAEKGQERWRESLNLPFEMLVSLDVWDKTTRVLVTRLNNWCRARTSC